MSAAYELVPTADEGDVHTKTLPPDDTKHPHQRRKLKLSLFAAFSLIVLSLLCKSWWTSSPSNPLNHNVDSGIETAPESQPTGKGTDKDEGGIMHEKLSVG